MSNSTCSATIPGPYCQDLCAASSMISFMTVLNTLVAENDTISGSCERVTPIEAPESDYDFIVVGGGAGGAVVAARLSEIPDFRVLLIEAGHDESNALQIPSFLATIIGSEIDYNYYTTNESHACLAQDGSCYWTSAKCLGGNTVRNGLAYLRGTPEDYDAWAELGNEGWSYDEVLPYFKKSEDNGETDRVGTDYHGTGGPLSVERFPYYPPLADAIIAAGEEVGYNYSEDLNGNVTTGVSRIQATNKGGVRRSTSRAFLWPARNRSNLDVLLNTQVTKILIEDGQAVGVEVDMNGTTTNITAGKEVIVSGGAIRSPQILMLSGIGPEDDLESLGINVTQALPGVGYNLWDQVGHVLNFTINDTDVWDDNYEVAEQYAANQTGPLSSIGLCQVVFAVPSNSSASDYPDLQLYFYGYVASCGTGETDALKSSGKRAVAAAAGLMNPTSRGRISLASTDPSDQPVIWTNYLGESDDIDRLVTAIKLTLELAETDAMQAYNFTESTPVVEACSDYTYQSDEYWACAVQQNTFPQRRQGGSCKMGPANDTMAVVDPQLRVYGVNGLRVCDASISPQPVAGNMAPTAMLIGERCADFIKTDYGVQDNTTVTDDSTTESESSTTESESSATESESSTTESESSATESESSTTESESSATESESSTTESESSATESESSTTESESSATESESSTTESESSATESESSTTESESSATESESSTTESESSATESESSATESESSTTESESSTTESESSATESESSATESESSTTESESSTTESESSATESESSTTESESSTTESESSTTESESTTTV